jgi:hypothetical protein
MLRFPRTVSCVQFDELPDEIGDITRFLDNAARILEQVRPHVWCGT